MAKLRLQRRDGFNPITCGIALLFLAFVAQSCATLSRGNRVLRPGEASPGQTVITVQRGEASWYGPGFQGKKTAKGNSFDQTKLIAAHKTFPLGSKVKVVNLKNGNSVEVEITDRGPFTKGRVIDLSRAAAERLGIVGTGTAPVLVELLSERSWSR